MLFRSLNRCKKQRTSELLIMMEVQKEKEDPKTASNKREERDSWTRERQASEEAL